MHETKLGNKKLLIFFKKYKHLKMRIAYPFWAKNVFIPNEKIPSTPVLKGPGVLKIPRIKSSCGGKRTTPWSLFFSNGLSRKSTSFNT